MPAKLLLPFSITASSGLIQSTAWQYVIERAAAVLSSAASGLLVSVCMALARKRCAYLSSPPATSAGTGRSQNVVIALKVTDVRATLNEGDRKNSNNDNAD
ncbi:hypothetical protein L1887_46460 [Cichorium endivia]|nr:hypothetical protein L1887_46460 [Cichorium endivia]